MAELILSALLPIVFEKLTSAALNKVARSKEIQSQLKKLKTSLPNIQALLNDAAEKEIQDRSVKDWLKSLQHVAYDVDDVLDSLVTDAIHSELTEKPAGGGITRRVRKIIPACCTTIFSSSNTEMHDKLNDITTKLQELYDQKTLLGLKVKDKRSKNINRISQTSVIVPGIVGRQDEKKVLVQKLYSDEPDVNQNNFGIVPIVGMGGIGKTTLARLLYNEPEVEDHFDLKAWVCVSDEFDSLKIGEAIFQSIAGEEKKGKVFKDLNQLHEALSSELSGKKFLLVLDDVWSERIEDWNTLVPPFHAAAPGSKIMITTRKTELLQKLGNDNPYHLNKLSHDDALSLFAHHSLGATNFDSYPFLKPYGEGIVQKCDGLPLALISLGTSLKTRIDEEDWSELLNSTIWNLKDGGGILPALRLSYQELSASLKQLFAYSSLFPKDYVFEKEDLILLWMAEGFLNESTEGDSTDMERLGEKYFDELLSKSFFECVNNDKSLFVMHDLMNDLATSVAGEFFVRLDIETKIKTDEGSLKKYRHMSFVREEFMALKKFKAFEKANKLRTFLAVPVVVGDGWKRFSLSNQILVDLLPRLPLLRALCLSKLEIDEVPESVGDLKHLRYLNVSQTQITHLPESVCNLYNLQTLIVFGCDNLSKLPESFLKLKNLRHLDIRDTPLLKNMPFGIGEMKSLQTLSKIVIGGENEFPISGLKKLKNLRRRVCIHGLDKLQNNDQTEEVSLSQMRLSELVVQWSNVFDGSRNQILEKEVLDVLKPHRKNLKKLRIMSYGGTKFPKWVGDSCFSELTDISIRECRNCVFFPPLGQLPLLKNLFIRNMDKVKEVRLDLLGNGHVAFPSLKSLRFEKLPVWELWSMNAVGCVAVFPCLEELWIRDCPALVKVSLEALPTLRVLNVSKCGEGVLKSVVVAASSVTELIIRNISGLSDEVWGGIVNSLGALEKLTIRDCNDLRNLWESEEEAEACVKEVLVNLQKLTITECKKLVRIGGKQNSGSNLPTSLSKLHIATCTILKHLSCPDSIQTLNILRCYRLEHLSCPVNNIQNLKIHGWSSIKYDSFPTGGGGGGKWQKLKSLAIMGFNCEVVEKEFLNITSNNANVPSMLYLKSSFIHLTTLVIRNRPMIIESFPDLHNLTSLNHLEIIHCPGMDGPPPSSSSVSVGVWPPKLESLEIGHLKRPISEWGPLPNSLVALSLYGGFGGSSSEEEDVKSFPTSSLLPYSSSSALIKLELHNFKKMERISSEGLQHLTSLQHLQISYCPELKYLPETLLPSLLSLTIFPHPNEELEEKMSRRSGSYWPLLSHIPRVSK